MQQELWIDTIASPLGDIMIVTNEQQIHAIDFADCADRMTRSLTKRLGPVQLRPSSNPLGASDCLQAYLAGELTALDAIALAPGGTPFQQTVWQALRTIPPGTTRTYQQLATQIGQPNACRAVGLANAQNPIAIAIPCHRVIGSTGALTGYAGGIQRKQWLLHHEGIERETPTPAAQLTLF